MEVKVLGSPLYQWEMGRKIKITPPANAKVDRVDFASALDANAVAVKPHEENGVITADIPSILLQSGNPIFVYLVCLGEDLLETTASYVLSVIKRPKPADYVYTETEVKTWESLDQRIKVLESGGASPDVIEQAVKEYLKENPVQAGATQEEARQIQQNKQDIETLSEEKLSVTELNGAINTALAQAKASGEFDGKDGADYVLTEADKKEIAGMVEVPGGGGNVDLSGYATKKYVDDAIANLDIPSGGSAEWKTLDTLDLSSGALSYEVDTTGCTEITIIQVTALECSSSYVAWKGVSRVCSLNKVKGNILSLNYLGAGLITAITGRTSDTLRQGACFTEAEETNNSLVLTFSASTSGTVAILGR